MNDEKTKVLTRHQTNATEALENLKGVLAYIEELDSAVANVWDSKGKAINEIKSAIETVNSIKRAYDEGLSK